MEGIEGIDRVGSRQQQGIVVVKMTAKFEFVPLFSFLPLFSHSLLLRDEIDFPSARIDFHDAMNGRKDAVVRAWNGGGNQDNFSVESYSRVRLKLPKRGKL